MADVMDLSKVYDFFQPDKIDGKIHIVGCGSVGSAIAENLARCGVTDFVLWDFDIVEAHNVANQMFTQADIKRPKVEALRDILVSINPEVADKIKLEPKGWKGKLMSGYIFLAVDNIDIRREIVEKHYDSPYVKAVFDFRTMLESAQHFAADWQDEAMKKSLLNSMQFSHDEASAETPTSACGVTLGVVTTVRTICELGVNNFIKDTVASMIEDRLTNRGEMVLITHYADLLKFICTSYFGWNGLKDEDGRHLLQYVGTEVIRYKNPSLWVDFVADMLTYFDGSWDYVIIPDCRFPNEVTRMAEKFDTIYIRVERPNFVSRLTKEQLNHPSELALDDYAPDYKIINDSSKSELLAKVSLWIEEILYGNEKH